MNGVVKNISALSIVTTGQLPKLTKGQSDLLKVIRECVYKSSPLSFDLIVDVYYHNVRKSFLVGEGWYRKNPDDFRSGEYARYVEYDILDCWKKQQHLYRFKSLVRQWFVSSIGILVIKNQLVIIPTIDLGDE